MTAEQAISMIVGAVLSIVLQTVPKVKNWWTDQRGKVIILIALHIGSAVILWVIDCVLGINTGIYMICNWEGLGKMGWTGTLGFISNQTTYGLSEYGVPAAKTGIQKARSFTVKTLRRK